MKTDYIIVALRNLVHQRTRTFLTLIGIIIGIAAVVALISLGQGMKDAIGQIFLNIGSDKLIITAKSSTQFSGPPGSSAASNLTIDDIGVIKAVPGVAAVGGRLIKSVKLEFGREVVYYFAVSIPDDDKGRELIRSVNNYKIEQGRLLKRGDRFKAFIGYNLAHKDVFKQKEIAVGNRIKMNGLDFEVVGILKKSGSPQQDRVMVVPEDALREVLKLDKKRIDVIAVQVQKGLDAEKVAENIERAMRNDRNLKLGKEDFEIQTPGQLLASLDSILTIVQVVLIGIAAISLLVGGIGIANTMYTSVLERTKEIGVMKSIGARNSDILSIFIIESSMLGLLGGVIGIGIGMGLSKLVELTAAVSLGTSLIKAYFPLPLIIGSLLFSLCIGTLSGFFPARQAARLRPVDALRYE